MSSGMLRNIDMYKLIKAVRQLTCEGMYKSYNEVVSTSIAWKPELDPYTTFNL